MAPRDPGRTKAALINDVKFLDSVDAYRDRDGAFPIDLWRGRGYPTKVVIEKTRKLIGRGYLSPDWYVTTRGREFLQHQRLQEGT